MIIDCIKGSDLLILHLLLKVLMSELFKSTHVSYVGKVLGCFTLDAMSMSFEDFVSLSNLNSEPFLTSLEVHWYYNFYYLRTAKSLFLKLFNSLLKQNVLQKFKMQWGSGYRTPNYQKHLMRPHLIDGLFHVW